MAKLGNYRLLTLFLMLYLFTPCAYSQLAREDEEERTFYGGLIVGSNFCQVDGDNFAGYHKAGWNAGVVVYTKLASHLMASMELLYSQKGSRAAQNQLPRLANDQSTVLVDYNIRLNYAEIPLCISYFDKKNNHIGAGASYAYLAKSKETYKDASGAVYEQDAKLFPFRKHDINLMVHANIHIYKRFFINARYQYSMLSIRSINNFVTGRPQQFNNLWSIRAMYIF